MVGNYMLYIVLDKILKINRHWKFHNTKILSDTDNKLPVIFLFKNVAILITCVIDDDGKR